VVERKIPVAASNTTAKRASSWAIGASSLFFILLQSACTAVMAISGLRLVIGIGSLAAATSVVHFFDTIHGNTIRIPMEILAILGSIVNLYVVWRIRYLRSRPSSQWRTSSATPINTRSEMVQIVLALLTLLLVAVEWYGHLRFYGSV
jgi:hypothetical protein